MPKFPFRLCITVILTNAEFIVPILQVGTPRPGFVPWLHDNKLCDFRGDDELLNPQSPQL